jgi:hypothetical protein
MDLYILRGDVDHLLPEEDWDAVIIHELDPIYGIGLAARDLANVPPMPLRMTGTPIGRTDRLFDRGSFLVITPRFLHLLESLGDFPHQVIPAYLVQDRDDWRDHPPIDTTSFVVCNLHRHLRVIDLERSVLTSYPDTDAVRHITKLVPIEGVTVPPLFRQDNWSADLLIPRATRDAILAAGIRGVRMPPLEGSIIHLANIHPPLR